MITTYPPDLDVIDGRIFSPANSGSESISPTPAFPVSPETPYGKKKAELPVCNPTPSGWRGGQLLTLPSFPGITSPHFSPFSPSAPQMGSPSALYKGAHGKTPTSFPLLWTSPHAEIFLRVSHLRNVVLAGEDSGTQHAACWG